MDIRQQDLGLLLSLNVLLEEGNVSRAAERLGISQPALSSQLSRLRDLFGDPLLVRSGRKMVPTAMAEELKEPLAAAIVDLLAIMRERKSFRPAQSDRTFRLVATDYIHLTICEPLLRALRSHAPNVRLALLPLDAARIASQLEENAADLVITSDRLTPPSAQKLTLLTERFVMVQRKGHPRGKSNPTLDEFCDLDHALVSPKGGGFFGAIDEALSKLARRRNVAVSLPSFLLVDSVLQKSDLVAVIPARLALSIASGCDILELPVSSDAFEVAISWHARSEADEGHRWLRELIVSTHETGRS